jgi:hypothetical protein
MAEDCTAAQPSRVLRFILAALLLSVSPIMAVPDTPDEIAREIILPLIDPAKLDTLKGDRAANRRLRLVCYHLEAARRDGQEPADIIRKAQVALRMADTPRAKAVEASLLRNLDILEKLGCLDEAGMGKLRTGNAPTITRGPYAGDIASVDHIIPRSVCEELDERLYNLEFMPSRMNSKKSDKIGLRQMQLARKWNAQKLLSDEGLQAVEKEVQK